MGMVQVTLVICTSNDLPKDATEPSRGTFTFNNGDVVANLARGNGQILRGAAISMTLSAPIIHTSCRSQLCVA